MLVKSQGKGQTIEMQAASATIVCKTGGFPCKEAASYEYLREIAHLRPAPKLLGGLSFTLHFELCHA